MVEALDFVDHAVARLGEDTRDRVVLVAGEVLGNVIEHGGVRPDCEVVVEVEGDDRQLELRIRETGLGVSTERVTRSALPDDPLAESGRGLYIIRALADAVYESERGGVCFVFELTAGSRPPENG